MFCQGSGLWFGALSVVLLWECWWQDEADGWMWCVWELLDLGHCKTAGIGFSDFVCSRRADVQIQVADKGFQNSPNFWFSSIKFRCEWHLRCQSLLWVELKDHINDLNFIAGSMGITGKVAKELCRVIADRTCRYIPHSESWALPATWGEKNPVF